jgi:flagellar basal body rod protein FlgF
MKHFKWLLIVLCIFFSCNNNVLLDEYKLLYIDIENYNTYGYKSYFHIEKSMATFEINNGQGVLIITEIPTDFAIVGHGFFKVKIEDSFGYTRNGNIVINEYGELRLLSKYSLYEPVYLPEYFIPETLDIKENGDIFVSVPQQEKLIEVYAGQLKTYDIPTNLLEHYENGIYKLKVKTNEEKLIVDNKIFNKFIEGSNLFTLACLLRMYYILSNLDDKSIANIEYKKEIIKILIDKIIEGKNQYGIIDVFVPYLRYNY